MLMHGYQEEIVAERIRTARDEVGISAEELGRRVNISGHSILDYEKSHTAVRLDMVERIAKALGYPLEYFMPEWFCQPLLTKPKFCKPDHRPRIIYKSGFRLMIYSNSAEFGIDV